MNGSVEERPITERVSERPAMRLGKLKRVSPRELVARFLVGAVTSIVVGIIGDIVSARVDGLFLAFPAILGASLTLIEEQEDSAEAREDCRGAVMGGLGLALFAAVAALALGHINSATALLLAACAWFAGAIGGYLIAWFR